VRILVKKRNVVRLQKLREDEEALERQSEGAAGKETSP
jgi:hypothetical protein